jgi:superfamily II DNA or RNA helicase
MLQLCTGAGKTVIAANIIRSARERGKRLLFVVDAISLIGQTVAAFRSEGITDIGVIQADHCMTDWSKPVQVASVQTLQKRGMPEADLVIVDEAHCVSQWLVGTMASPEWCEVPFIGLSATPWTKGLGHIYTDLLRPVSMQELIDLGFLAPFRVFAASHPDLTGVKTTAGDYNQDQLGGVMAKAELVADVVATYQRLGERRPAFAFCVDRAHAKALQQRFEAAGVPAGYIDAYTPAEDRQAIRRQLDRGQIRVVCNIGTMTKGVDWEIGCIILARPTKSEMLYVQMVGRGLRVNAGMSDCLILDFADNTLRMGFVTDINRDALCMAKRGEKAKVERDVPLPKECPSCTFLKPPKVIACPSCGFKPEKRSGVQEEDGELIEITPGKKPPAPTMDDKRRWHAELSRYASEKRFNKGWIAHTYRKKFGVWPTGVGGQSAGSVSPEVLGYVKSLMIARKKAVDGKMMGVNNR